MLEPWIMRLPAVKSETVALHMIQQRAEVSSLETETASSVFWSDILRKPSRKDGSLSRALLSFSLANTSSDPLFMLSSSLQASMKVFTIENLKEFRCVQLV